MPQARSFCTSYFPKTGCAFNFLKPEKQKIAYNFAILPLRRKDYVDTHYKKMVAIEVQQPSNEGSPKQAPVTEDAKPTKPTEFTPAQQLQYLLATANILIKNSNAVIEKMNKIDSDLDYLFSKVGHTRPEKEEKKEEDGATGATKEEDGATGTTAK